MTAVFFYPPLVPGTAMDADMGCRAFFYIHTVLQQKMECSREVKKEIGGMKSLKQVWDRSPPPPVADEGGRSIGNRRERLWRDCASSPGRQPNGFPSKPA